MRPASSLALLLSASLFSAATLAQTACDDFTDDMTCFQNGTTADADQVNTNFKALLDKIQELQAQIDAGGGADPVPSGAATTYIRWGRTVCPGSASVVYTGYAAGGHYTYGGNSNTVCLTDTPIFNDAYVNDGNQDGALLYGTEYQTSVMGIAQFNSLHDHEAPCVTCLQQASTSLMIPGTRNCPAGWNREYEGFLMGQNYKQSSSDLVCVDMAPETIRDINSSPANNNGNLWYPTEAQCNGTLPCPPYVHNRELSCVVCTR